jgi:thymidylate synthase
VTTASESRVSDASRPDEELGAFERQYLLILRKALMSGHPRLDRTGIGTCAIFGEVMRFDLTAGFPAVTTKRLAFRSVVAELLWFLAGSSDVNELHALGVHIWDGNTFADYWVGRARFPGDAGRNYGQQWRDWVAPDGRHVDQLRDTIRLIREEPASRRMLVVAWNPGELQQTSLPACHTLFQFFVAENRLSLMMYQRSCDLLLGVPFNMAEYGLLLHLIAREVELQVHEFVHVLGDAHLYGNHTEAAREQLERKPYPAPSLWLDPTVRSVDDAVARYREIVTRAKRGEAPGPLLDGFARLENYQHHPPIKAKMAV